MKQYLLVFLTCSLISSCSLLDNNVPTVDGKNVSVSLKGGLATVVSSKPRGWKLNKSGSLKSEMNRWAKSVDWKVDWRISEDYPVLFSAEFQGPLIGENSVFVKVFDAVKDRTGRPLHITFKRGNKVIVVEDGGYWVKN